MTNLTNWSTEETNKELRKRAQKKLAQIKAQRKNKSFQLVKACDKPLTFKEVEVAPDIPTTEKRKTTK